MGKRGPTPKQGSPTTVRLEPDLRTRIEDAAAQSARTPAEEIRTRLRASFDSVEFTVPETKGLAYAIALALEIEKSKTGFHWFQTPWAFSRAKIAMNEALSFFRPPGDPDVIPEDAKPLRWLRSRGLEALIPDAIEQLKDCSSAELSGKLGVAKMEAVAQGKLSRLDALRPIAGVVKELLETLGNDTAAIKETATAVKKAIKEG